MPECCASFSTTSHEKDAESFDCRLLEPQSGKKKNGGRHFTSHKFQASYLTHSGIRSFSPRDFRH